MPPSSDANFSLLTDLYQLTMAYAAWKSEQIQKEAVFELYFRQNPFSGGYAINCGLSTVLELVKNFGFTQSDCDYLAGLKGGNGEPLFEPRFLTYLKELQLTVDIDAIEEGRVVFANEPLLRVQGPLLHCQLLETALLNFVNFQTLVATKAARVKEAAQGETVLEFGLRRAQGVDGGMAASRASYIGGADATSNVLAGKRYGIPVRGTHAHSWVMSFPNEREAFLKFAEAMPHNSVFLVDTYDTLEGIGHAIEAGLWLRGQGYEMQGIRLDSGDLAYLSIEGRRMLDEAGFPNAQIVASNDLDEHLIQNLKIQGARIDIWGVGTRLVTAYDQPALGGVYKLVALRSPGGAWDYKVKLSEQIAKITTPGIHQVRRYHLDGMMAGDMVYDQQTSLPAAPMIVDPMDPTRRKQFHAGLPYEDLLKPVVRNGQLTQAQPDTIEQIRGRRQADLQALHPTSRRFLNPHPYPVGLELNLFEVKSQMILKLRGFGGAR